MSAKPEVTSLTDWRQNPQLVGWAFKTFNRPEWKLLVTLMQESEHVRLYKPAEPITADQKLGRIEGWDLYNLTLKRAAESLTVEGPMPEATFQPAELPKELEEKE